MKDIRLVSLGLVLCLSNAGCRGYWPLRWPGRHLWQPASVEDHPPIDLPEQPIDSYPYRVSDQQVSVALDLLSEEEAKELFGMDLIRKSIQPCLLKLQNNGDAPYRFAKSGVSPRLLPSDQVAPLAYPHSVVRGFRIVKWLAYFPLGLVFSSVIEPLTTIDFPVIQEVSSRPGRSMNAVINRDFVNAEIADAVIEPYGTLFGVLFAARSDVRSDHPVRVTLTNVRTQEPLTVEIPLPRHALNPLQHTYRYPVSKVWGAALDVVPKITTWTVRSIDQAHGTVSVETGGRFFWWSSRMILSIDMEPVNTQWTEVGIRRIRPDSDALEFARTSRSLVDFFQQLNAQLPPERPQASTPALNVKTPSYGKTP